MMEPDMTGDRHACLKEIVATQRKMNVAYDREVAERLRQARAFVETVPAALLKLDRTLRRIVLFGSVATGKAMRADFDIDLAVDSDRYIQIVGWSLRQPWRIDIVDLQAIDEGFAGEIERTGRVLYEAQR